jgi:hypothetical protein
LAPVNLAWVMGMWLLGFVLNAAALAVIVRGLGITSAVEAIWLAVIVWAGLGLAFSSWPVIHARQPVGLWLINNGAHLLMQVVMAVILAVWR